MKPCTTSRYLAKVPIFQLLYNLKSNQGNTVKLKYFSLNTFAAFLANVAIAQLREKNFAKICKNKLKFAKFYNPVLVHTLVPTAELYLIGSAHNTVLS